VEDKELFYCQEGGGLSIEWEGPTQVIKGRKESNAWGRDIRIRELQQSNKMSL